MNRSIRWAILTCALLNLIIPMAILTSRLVEDRNIGHVGARLAQNRTISFPTAILTSTLMILITALAILISRLEKDTIIGGVGARLPRYKHQDSYSDTHVGARFAPI